MNREEALKQIAEINRTVEASNKFMPSGILTVFLGITILLIPAIEIFSRGLTFGHDFKSQPFLVPALHIFVYLILFSVVRLVVEKIWPDDLGTSPHPALSQALAFHRPVITAICGCILMLGYLGLEQLIYPLFLILFGILVNLYGRFSSRKLFWAGWSYIVLGIIFGILTEQPHPYLWVIFNSYLGLSLIYVGISIRSERKQK